jgi:hypothetical protein
MKNHADTRSSPKEMSKTLVREAISFALMGKNILIRVECVALSEDAASAGMAKTGAASG